MVDVIIPSYQPDETLIRLFDNLRKQTMEVHKVIVINTEEKLWNEFVEKYGYDADAFSWVEVHHIARSEFNHGRTRNVGVSYSDADIFIMMTQDAVPYDEFFIENLVAPLKDGKVAASYARQMARNDATIVEQITREFNYPDESRVKTIEDLDSLGIKTFFCSNVSCAYTRRIFDELGGFIDRTIFNEDMIFAFKLLKEGYAISYTADARVLHSHNYSGLQQFRRNVDLGVSQGEHPEIFASVPSTSEGKKLVKSTISELKKRKRYADIFHYIYVSGCKYMGYLIGTHYKSLPRSLVKKCSMSPGYFE